MENDNDGNFVLGRDTSYTDLQYSFSIIVPCCTNAIWSYHKVYNYGNKYKFVGAVEIKYYRLLLGRDIIKKAVIHCVKCVSDEGVKKIFPEIYSTCNFIPVCPEMDYERVLL